MLISLAQVRWQQRQQAGSLLASCAGVLWNLVQDTLHWPAEQSTRAIKALVRHLAADNEELVLRIAGALRSRDPLWPVR